MLSDPLLATERPDILSTGFLLGYQFAPILSPGFRHLSNMPPQRPAAEERFSRRLHRVCEVIQFLADKGAPLDERNAQGRTPIDLADGLPIDKAVDLFTKLIVQSGAKPKSPSKREQDFEGSAVKGN
jgi:hypothetical protein